MKAFILNKYGYLINIPSGITCSSKGFTQMCLFFLKSQFERFSNKVLRWMAAAAACTKVRQTKRNDGLD